MGHARVTASLFQRQAGLLPDHSIKNRGSSDEVLCYQRDAAKT